MEDIARWIRHLRALVADAGEHRRQRIVELLCRYDQLATWIAHDQRDYPLAFGHANRAVKLATAAGNPELIAASLFRRGRTHLEQGDFAAAVADLDAALPHAQRARPQLKGLVLLAAGHARAHVAASATESLQAVAVLDQASRIVRRGGLEDDESFVKLSAGRYHLDRAGALLALRRPEDALDELSLADRGIGPDQTRRHAYINVLRAQAYTNMNEMSVATAAAEDALLVSKALKSGINVARIVSIHAQLSRSKYGNSPQVARLGAMLVMP
jgi:tetratricopeptide (TPR) repeat protein